MEGYSGKADGDCEWGRSGCNTKGQRGGVQGVAAGPGASKKSGWFRSSCANNQYWGGGQCR